MLNPFKYNPAIDKGEEVEWEDNWLSNALAWASDMVIPKQCTTPGAIMPRITNYLWTSCSCCLFWRGVTFGVSVPIIAVALVAAAMYVF